MRPFLTFLFLFLFSYNFSPFFFQVHFKGRLLDKLLRKQNLSDTVARRSIDILVKSEQLILDKKQKIEDNEAKRKIRVEEKDLKIKQLAAEAGRRNEIRIKIRDIEKVRKEFYSAFHFRFLFTFFS
jgi:hypothetical protein